MGYFEFRPLDPLKASLPCSMCQDSEQMLDKERLREIHTQIRRVLMAEWDPIGVSGIPQAADEYDGYIGGVYKLLDAGASEREITAHLRKIEIDQMGTVNAQGLPLLPAEKRDAVTSSLRRLISK